MVGWMDGWKSLLALAAPHHQPFTTQVDTTNHPTTPPPPQAATGCQGDERAVQGMGSTAQGQRG